MTESPKACRPLMFYVQWPIDSLVCVCEKLASNATNIVRLFFSSEAITSGNKCGHIMSDNNVVE